MNRARGLIYVLTTRAPKNGRNFQPIIGHGDRPGDGTMRAAAVRLAVFPDYSGYQ